MKKLILIFTAYLISSQGYTQNSKTIKSKPDKATVYLTGAELSYQEAVSLIAGMNEIIIEGVAPSFDENSLSVVYKGNAIVIDTKKSTRYNDPKAKGIAPEQKYDKDILAISDSLLELSYVAKDIENKTNTLEREEQLLTNNKLIRGEFTKDSVSLLKSALDLLHTRLNAIQDEQIVWERKAYVLNKKKQGLLARKSYLEQLRNNGGIPIDPEDKKPITQIIITLQANAPTSGNLILKYYTSNAGWIPLYDIQANSGKENINLVYRAQVYQNSGLDWKDISLKLSTSNPAYTNIRPIMNPANLYFRPIEQVAPVYYKEKKGAAMNIGGSRNNNTALLN